MLMSPTLTLEHRPKDKDLIKKSIETAKKEYKEISGRDVEVDTDASLPDDSAGGVVGSTMNGKIKVDNTLDERLKILQEKVRPAYYCRIHELKEAESV
jgi:V-type H+-transporting ATPase subunit E